MHIGGRIKVLIEKKEGLKKIDFARRIGYTEQALHKIFNKEDVSTEVLKSICAALGITMVDFFTLPHETAKHSGKSALAEPAAGYEKTECSDVRRLAEHLEIQVEADRANIKALHQLIDMQNKEIARLTSPRSHKK